MRAAMRWRHERNGPNETRPGFLRFLPALNDAASEYRVTVTERCSGLSVETRLMVN